MDEGPMDQYLGYARLKKNPGPYGKEYFAPKSWGEIDGAAIAKAELERDRLLYVAATRARNLLIISSSAAKDNPWDKLIAQLPQSTKNIMEEVYREEPFDELPKFKTEVESPEINIDNMLNEIRKRRNEAINNNLPTYEMYSPSQKKLDSKSKHENQDYELERKIVENTMTVFMRGDEEVTEAGRLELGTAIHKLFETIIKDDSRTGSIIKWISEKTDLEYLDEELLNNIASSFRSSKILERIKESEEVYTEVPFSLKVNSDSEFAGFKPSHECYVSGYIDLIFKEQDGWTVLDYKTCSPHEVKHELQKFYQPQLDAYKEVWEKITGEKVKGTELFFIEKHMVSAMDEVV
jgi:ATP-dependent helicase/nuclease subunit A